MTRRKSPDILQTDELYWTNWRSNDPDSQSRIGLPQARLTIAPTGRDAGLPPYINDRLRRINLAGWDPHVPSLVSLALSSRGRYSKVAIEIFRQELELREQRIAIMAEYVAAHPLFAVVTNLGTGASLYEQSRYAGQIRDFIVTRQDKALLVEPIVEGAHGKLGRLPRMLLEGSAYAPVED